MPRPRVVVLAEARRELIDAAAYYDERREGYGPLFIDAIEREIQKLVEFPRIGKPVILGARRRTPRLAFFDRLPADPRRYLRSGHRASQAQAGLLAQTRALTPRCVECGSGSLALQWPLGRSQLPLFLRRRRAAAPPPPSGGAGRRHDSR